MPRQGKGRERLYWAVLSLPDRSRWPTLSLPPVLRRDGVLCYATIIAGKGRKGNLPFGAIVQRWNGGDQRKAASVVTGYSYPPEEGDPVCCSVAES